MSWMAKWPGSHPVFVKEARGARFTDVDGQTEAFRAICMELVRRTESTSGTLIFWSMKKYLTVVDIGASVGAFSEFIASQNSSKIQINVIAVEPLLDIAEKIPKYQNC
jgi:2-polyprenyl-3-methyl-5-hydroxy-6-metoxy-1,4-benzoquinol methylase